MIFALWFFYSVGWQPGLFHGHARFVFGVNLLVSTIVRLCWRFDACTAAVKKHELRKSIFVAVDESIFIKSGGSSHAEYLIWHGRAFRSLSALNLSVTTEITLTRTGCG
jgi:hypothetical protein